LSEGKLEKYILYIIVFILLGLLLALIMYMSFSISNFHIHRDMWGPISTFLGALFGALLSGLIAIMILFYQIQLNKKETHVNKYGSMKFVASKLLVFNELKRVTVSILNSIDELPQEKQLEVKNKLIKLIPIHEFIDLKVLMETERGNLPFDFVARYFTVVNILDYIIKSMERYKEKPDADNVGLILKHLEFGESVIDRYIENSFQYIKNIEKKFKIQDAY